jgi:hypothetical protein
MAIFLEQLRQVWPSRIVLPVPCVAAHEGGRKTGDLRIQLLLKSGSGDHIDSSCSLFQFTNLLDGIGHLHLQLPPVSPSWRACNKDTVRSAQCYFHRDLR